jgi:hypothetical protein
MIGAKQKSEGIGMEDELPRGATRNYEEGELDEARTRDSDRQGFSQACLISRGGAQEALLFYAPNGNCWPT